MMRTPNFNRIRSESEPMPVHDNHRLNGVLRKAFILLMIGCSSGSAAETWIRGISEPFRDIVLSAPVAGTVSAVKVTEGDQVVPGQVLVEFERQQEELEVQRRKLILDDRSEVEVAAVQVRTLVDDLATTRKLYESTGSVSKEEVAAKELRYEQAVAEQARLTALEKRQEVDLLLAKELVKQKTIISPIAGQVADLITDVGEGLKAQEPLVRIVDTSKFYFTANIEYRDRRRLKLNGPVEIALGPKDNAQRVFGKIVFISSVVDPGSGLLRIRALCENPKEKILPGIEGNLILSAP